MFHQFGQLSINRGELWPNSSREVQFSIVNEKHSFAQVGIRMFTKNFHFVRIWRRAHPMIKDNSYIILKNQTIVAGGSEMENDSFHSLLCDHQLHGPSFLVYKMVNTYYSIRSLLGRIKKKDVKVLCKLKATHCIGSCYWQGALIQELTRPNSNKK